MQSNELADLCVVSYSDLKYDARSSNLIDFYRSKGLKVVTYSLSPTLPENKDNLVFHNNPKNRFLINWINFIFNAFRHRQLLRAKLYFASDLYSLVLLRKLLISASKIIYDSREIFSALGTLENQTIKQKILAMIEKVSVRNLQKIVVSGELDAEYLKKYFSDYHKKYYVLKNLPKETEIIKTNYLREKFKIAQNKTILIYQGVILPGRGIMPIIKAIEASDDFVLVIIGEGNFRARISEVIVQNNLQGKVMIHPQVQYNDLLNITASADIGVSLIEPITFSYELALPNKLFEYVYAGLPVLVSDLPAMKSFVEENGVGEIVSRSLSKEQILDKLYLITQNLAHYKELIHKIKDNFTYQSQSKTLMQIIKL